MPSLLSHLNSPWPMALPVGFVVWAAWVMYTERKMR